VCLPCVSPGPTPDPDADFVYDYYTLRVGGLVFAGVIVFLSIILLAGNRIRNCSKSKVRKCLSNS
uniref:FXYD domain-containing ion transport regulator n=1 Tax=Myripristis murdjan TaxID=586833 RepID=A0A667XZH1_9TELE